MLLKNLTGGQIGAALGISAGAILAGGNYSELAMDWRDYAAFTLLALILVWCFSPSRDSLGRDGTHESAGDSFAFLLGKKLSGVFRRLKRSA